MREWEIGAVENIHGALPYIRFAPILALVGVGVNRIGKVDPVEFQVKFQSTGQVLRQHDPDFAPDDKILVFDNRNLDPFVEADELHSRIVELDARTGQARVVISGLGEARFYSPTMGRLQKLANGNLMIASTREGRALEFARTASCCGNISTCWATALPEFCQRPMFCRNI